MYHTKSHNAPVGSAEQLQMMYRDLKTCLICGVCGMCRWVGMVYSMHEPKV